MLYSFFESYLNVSLLNVDIISDVLEYLSKSYNLIGYSNWFSESQSSRLHKAGLDKYFSRIYGPEEIQVKPSIEGFLTITDNDKECIFIGDSIECDIKVPNELGFKTIFYNRKKIKQDTYQEIFNLEELKHIL